MPGIRKFLRERWRTAGEGKKVVAVNVAWRGLATGVNKVARLFIVLYAANRLGSIDFGVYSFVISLATLAFIFSDWGINILLMRDFVRGETHDDRERLLSTSLLLKIAIGLLSTVAIPLILIIGYGGELSLLPLALLFAGTMLIGNIRDISISLFLAVQKAQLEFAVYVVETLTIVASYFLVFRPSPSAFSLFLVYGLGSFASALCAFLLSRKIARFHVRQFSWQLGKKLLHNGLPLSLFGLATYLFFSADQLILKHYHGYEQVGIYSVGTRIVLAVAIVPGLLNSVILPHLSRYSSDMVMVKKIIRFCFLVLTGVASLFSVGIFLFGPWLVKKFFAEEFWSITPLLGPLSLMAIPMFAVSLFDYVLISYNLQKQDFYLTLGAGVLSIILNFLLVPPYGMAGAVIACVVSQFINAALTCGYMVWVLKKRTLAMSVPA